MEHRETAIKINRMNVGRLFKYILLLLAFNWVILIEAIEKYFYFG